MNKTTEPTGRVYPPSIPQPIPPLVDFGKVTEHLKEHQRYPATRAQLIAACTELSDFTGIEKEWFIRTLPDRTYYSADEVLAAVSKRN